MIRPIEPKDDDVLCQIIKTVMPEFGASGPGYAIHDPEVLQMSVTYSLPSQRYFVIEIAGKVLGGGGFAPLTGGQKQICEIRKMYFLPELRGQGWGRKLLVYLLAQAKSSGFTQCYLETLENMTTAKLLYESLGFKKLSAPMGNTGHFSCNSWYFKELL